MQPTWQAGAEFEEPGVIAERDGQVCVIRGGWKWLGPPDDSDAPQFLFQLEEDPGEKQNLIQKYPQRAHRLREFYHHQLSEYRRRGFSPPATLPEAVMTDGIRDALIQLGYLEDGGP